MDKRWVLKEKADGQVIEELSRSLNISKRLTSLLMQRDVKTYDDAEKFFRPELKHLHDPFLMKDMDKAVDRIIKAIDNGEKLMIFGDYDVDGTTAVSLVYSFLKHIHKKIEFYIPDRYDEGYGISYKGIDFAVANKITLMIALDCGIKAVEKVAYAKEKGLDIIIGDHHRPGDVLPDAVAVLDAKQADCGYPYKELSGCGVGFKLTQAVAMQKGIPEEKVFEGLDLLVVSIAADIVPITGENRIIAYYGLKSINTKPRLGLDALLTSAGLKKNTKGGDHYYERPVNINDLVFMVGPRINAAGRIESAIESVKLLISTTKEYAEKLGKEINELNLTRRDLDSNITAEAIDVISNDIAAKKKRTTVVYRDYWHKGVIGIVASRLIEKFYRPTIVLTKSDGLITGSARSIKNFDIYDAIDSCSHLLEHFGGHTYAAGMALKPENFDQFVKDFEAYAAERLTDDMLVPEIEIDEELYISDINQKFYRVMKQFAPFGPGNMSPLFKTNNVIDTGYVKVVGKNGHDHLKFQVVHPDRTGSPLPAIAFNLGHHYDEMRSGKTFDICYHIDENTWQGNTTLQLRIKDIKFN